MFGTSFWFGVMRSFDVLVWWWRGWGGQLIFGVTLGSNRVSCLLKNLSDPAKPLAISCQIYRVVALFIVALRSLRLRSVSVLWMCPGVELTMGR